MVSLDGYAHREKTDDPLNNGSTVVFRPPAFGEELFRCVGFLSPADGFAAREVRSDVSRCPVPCGKIWKNGLLEDTTTSPTPLAMAWCFSFSDPTSTTPRARPKHPRNPSPLPLPPPSKMESSHPRKYAVLSRSTSLSIDLLVLGRMATPPRQIAAASLSNKPPHPLFSSHGILLSGHTYLSPPPRPFTPPCSSDRDAQLRRPTMINTRRAAPPIVVAHLVVLVVLVVR
mmetsp:Transcript_34240/g.72048  ORF Transcript_34240/g.72048 Transcript_34240/m.72048 type:complete len:229 (+) Transcript_34240:992-1678(+)